MRTVFWIRNIFILLAAACLAVTFTSVSAWLPIAGGLLEIALWLALRSSSTTWRASVALVIYWCYAVAGTVLGLRALAMVFGGIAALAAWDLAIFADSLAMAASTEDLQTMLRAHMKALFMAVGISVLLALLLSVFELTLPLTVTAALAVALVASLVKFGRLLGIHKV